MSTIKSRFSLLVVSHPCVQSINQSLYARVEARTGWRVTILLPSSWKSDYGMRRATRWSGFRGRLIPMPVVFSGSVPFHAYRARLKRIVARERPQAIYVHHEPYGVATFQAFLASRQFADIPIGFYSAQNILKRYPWPISRFERYVYARASFAFPVSANVAAVLRRKGYRGGYAVLPLGIDTGLYRPDPAELSHNGAEHPLTVGYVGRITAEKGLDTLLSAMRLLPRERLHALIIGDGPAAAALQRRASMLGLEGRVSWLGYVPHDETPAVYRRMDVLVVPSRTVSNWKEQFGRVVIEALACGVPVVTSDSGELPGLVSATGGGWTFPEGNAERLAAILRTLVSRRADLRMYGSRGRAVVREQFDIDALADRFITCVQAAAGHAGARC